MVKRSKCKQIIEVAMSEDAMMKSITLAFNLNFNYKENFKEKYQ